MNSAPSLAGSLFLMEFKVLQFHLGGGPYWIKPMGAPQNALHDGTAPGKLAVEQDPERYNCTRE